jgi:nicotinate-nucleotide adenylyltransferase
MTLSTVKGATAYFFGSFNPLHLGHVLLAQSALYQLALAEVVLVPTGQPPHRQGLWPIEHRLAMAKLSCQGLAGLRVSDVEGSDEAHYTAATLQQLVGQHPPHHIPLVLGEDAYQSLPTWQQPDWLQAHTLAVVAHRPEVKASELKGWATYRLAMPLIGVSATWLRERLAVGDEVRPWLHPEALDYGQQHQLWP